MHRIIPIIAALVLAIPLAAAPPKKLEPAEAFMVCDEAERRTREIMRSWQLQMPRQDALYWAGGNKALEAVVADLYDAPAWQVGRTKQEFFRKWQERCLANPEAFVLPSK